MTRQAVLAASTSAASEPAERLTVTEQAERSAVSGTSMTEYLPWPDCMSSHNGLACTTAGMTLFRSRSSVRGAPLPKAVLPKTGGAGHGDRLVEPALDRDRNQHKGGGGVSGQIVDLRLKALPNHDCRPVATRWPADAQGSRLSPYMNKP